jgi:hypothetical protein
MMWPPSETSLRPASSCTSVTALATPIGDVGEGLLDGGGRLAAVRLAVFAVHLLNEDGLGGGGLPQSVARMTFTLSGSMFFMVSRQVL